MNPTLLRSTWAEAAAFGDRFVLDFYARLFAEHPHLRGLFGTTMDEQRAKIATTLDLVVQGADNLEAVVPRLRALGRMHRRFGVMPDMFGPVKEALLQTFRRFLGDRWTPEAHDTWSQAIDLVAGVMLDAYREADRFGGQAVWDALIVATSRTDDGSVLAIDVDPDAAIPWEPFTPMPARLVDRPGTWRAYMSPAAGRLLVPVDVVPDAVTLDLLSAQPGDHLLIAEPIDALDPEVTA